MYCTTPSAEMEIVLGSGRKRDVAALDEASHRCRTDHQLSVGIDAEVAGPRIDRLSVRVLDLKETISGDGHVQRIAGFEKRTLLEIGLDALDLRAQANGHAGGGKSTRLVFGSRQHFLPVKEVLEIRAALLEGRRVDVRQVVGDHIELRFHGLHAGGGRIQCLNTHAICSSFTQLYRTRKMRLISDPVV